MIDTTQHISEVFNEDCMIGMARYPDKWFDLAVVDPPYGSSADNIKSFKSNSINKKAKRKVYNLFQNNSPEFEYYEEIARVSKNQIIWGGNFLGIIGGVIVWDKNGTAFGEAEVAICSTHKSVRIFEYTWNGMIQQDMSNKEERIHPTQKPVALYDWIYKNYLPNGGKVFDSHLGSQSNRISAFKRGNIIFDACELDVYYFNDGNDRYDEFLMKYQPAELNPITKQGQTKLF